MAGNESIIVARLQPMRVVTYPNKKDPSNPLMQWIDPIQDSCAVVNGPVTNGVFADANTDKAGAIHPSIKPQLNIIRFTI